MSLFSCGSVHQGLDPERFSDECGGRGEIYMCLAAVFGDSRINGGAKISIKSSFTEILFLSVHSAAVKCQAKILLVGVNSRL